MRRVAPEIRGIIENVPGTLLTGPVENPHFPGFKGDDIARFALGKVDELDKLRRSARQQELIREFRALRQNMMDLGYNWVNDTGRPEIGGYLRRPKGNPKDLPCPEEVNHALRGLYEQM